MNFHGIEKDINISAKVVKVDESIQLSGKFSVYLTEFLIERPSLLTMKVDDEINLEFELYFN